MTEASMDLRTREALSTALGPVHGPGALGMDLICAVEAGSRAYGTATPESDHDIVAVALESDVQTYGLERTETTKYRVLRREQLHPQQVPLRYRSAGEADAVVRAEERQDAEHGSSARIKEEVAVPLSHDVASPHSKWLQRLGAGRKDSRSEPTDVELVVHPMRKFVGLAAAGNPSVLSMLWTPRGTGLDHLVAPAFELIAEHRLDMLTKHAGFRHAGYARAQRQAMLGLTNKRTNRPELVAEHGFDSKYGSHVVRLLLAGLDLVRERTYHMPMKPEQLKLLTAIRRGEVPLDDVLAMSESMEHELESLTEASDLPEQPDYDRLGAILKKARYLHVRERDGSPATA